MKRQRDKFGIFILHSFTIEKTETRVQGIGNIFFTQITIEVLAEIITWVEKILGF